MVCALLLSLFLRNTVWFPYNMISVIKIFTLDIDSWATKQVLRFKERNMYPVIVTFYAISRFIDRAMMTPDYINAPPKQQHWWVQCWPTLPTFDHSWATRRYCVVCDPLAIDIVNPPSLTTKTFLEVFPNVSEYTRYEPVLGTDTSFMLWMNNDIPQDIMGCRNVFMLIKSVHNRKNTFPQINATRKRFHLKYCTPHTMFPILLVKTGTTIIMFMEQR